MSITPLPFQTPICFGITSFDDMKREFVQMDFIFIGRMVYKYKKAQ
ncbi:hypothetical protein BAME_13350 [Bacillus sp. M 2-6]|nr:hypothetical protein BAME_13350 [Bacillus sp. M 2-6]